MKNITDNKEWWKPNFFIIGAPKCGTTSLSVYLGEHPRICMSKPKEPHYFNKDMICQRVETLSEYARCFSHAHHDHVRIGEASISYLYSENAISSILLFNPDAKFIVMVRNPIEMAYALHGELLYNGQENEKDFSKAWGMRENRLQGLGIPKFCKEPFWLQYRKACCLGERLEWLFSIINREIVHVIVIDDMKTDMPTVYETVLDFLEVQSDGRKEFPVANKAKVARSPLITRTLRIIEDTKRRLRFLPKGIGLIQKLHSLNTKTQRRKPIEPELRALLSKEFRADVEKLSHLLDRDLTHWVSS